MLKYYVIAIPKDYNKTLSYRDAVLPANCNNSMDLTWEQLGSFKQNWNYKETLYLKS